MENTGNGTPTVHEAAAARRLDALFKAMSTDFLLREQFVTDPAQIIAEYVRGTRLTPQQADTANHFVYAVMSNPALVRWLREQILTHRREDRRPDALLADFGRAVVEHRAEHVVGALLRSSAEQEPIVGLDSFVPSVLVGSQVFREFAATEMSTGADPLTEQSGTHVSAVVEVADPLTEQSGTHISTGGGGTDPLTEQSGTHVSMLEDLGDLREILGAGRDSVALAELMRFATRLRDRGLLGPVGATR
ncbi:hypothetical protein J5Y04_35855 [Kitasatospora sp. RG8]|uniref:hypothetical protein n=1 Tax=Kitasatospora sp. RG8 TaxID=2820815 RepID=UPI001ADFEC85|nr:hypothetical protein [Kitasatospora sp. RG8]MBP0454854.1 hypothetical protein [Kitasatospora sp. RG8]